MRTPATADSLGRCPTGQNNRKMNATILNAPNYPYLPYILKFHRNFAVQMKKFFFTIVAVLYLGMSSGIALEVHYCMGKLAGLEFFSSENKKCGKCGMKEKKGGCCSNEQHFLKISDSHKNIANNINFSFEHPALVPSFFNYSVVTPIQKFVKKSSNLSPPPDILPKRCILFCVFRL